MTMVRHVDWQTGEEVEHRCLRRIDSLEQSVYGVSLSDVGPFGDAQSPPPLDDLDSDAPRGPEEAGNGRPLFN